MHYTGRLGLGRKFYGREIYHKLLPRLVAELDGDNPYIPTTPYGDINSFKINRPLTTHRWDVWTGYKPVREYLCRPEDLPAFVTEFGLQSLPSVKMVRDLCGGGKFRIGDAAVEKHNYQTDGNSRLYCYVGDLFGPEEEPEKFVYFSQLTQARAAKLYVEHLRANNKINRGNLFWQFNDCFAAISWSAIDFSREPKALYYYAKRFFSGLLVTVGYELEKARVNQQAVFNPTKIVLINDSNEQITATVRCRLVDLQGSILDQITFPVSVSPFAVAEMMKLPRAISAPSNPERCILHLLLEKDGEMKAENIFLYLPDKYISWPPAQIQKQLIKLDKGLWKLILKTDAFVKDLQVLFREDVGAPVRLSDNFLDIFPGCEKEIIIEAGQKAPQFSECIAIDFNSVNKSRDVVKD
jgi:beta-mannosidase